MSQLKIKNGNNWESIPASGIGVPSGGTTGQVLQKSSNTDYATEWADLPLFAVQELTLEDDVSLAANATYAGNDVSVSKTGYLPLGVVGWRFGLATSGGTNPQICYPYTIEFNQTNETVRIRVKNQNQSTAAKIKIVAWVLYIQNQ